MALHLAACGDRMEPKMRLTGALIVLGVAAFVFLMPSASQAAWCATFPLGGENCYATFEQCRAGISGIGGSCSQSRDAVLQSGSGTEPEAKPQSRTKPKAKPATPAPAR
jgi:hypothetical protein